MKTGFLWGILAGGIAATAMVWVVPAVVGPEAPAPSALTGKTGSSGGEPAPSTTARPEAPGPAAGAKGGAPPPTGATEQEPDRLAAVGPTDPVPAGETAKEPDAATTGPADGTPEAEAAAGTPADSRAPAFDVVRVDPSGQTVLAGTAAPGETVEVMLDGKVVDEVQVDESGKFVAVLTAEPTGGAHELRLRVAVPEAGAGLAPARSAAPLLPSAGADAGPTPPTVRLRQPQQASASAETAEAPATDVPAPSASPPVIGSVGSPTLDTGSAGVLAARDPTVDLVSRGQPTVPGAGDAAAGSSATPPPGQRYLFSAPVIILPSQQPDDAPAVVEAGRDELAMLQPQGGAVEGVVLDQLTYDPEGRVVLSGRARPGHAVRIYGNGGLLGTAPTADGAWQLALTEQRARDLQLLRFDEIDRAGRVTSRIEAPFEYSVGRPQTVQNREIVIERGDNLWRIAEQFYGEGIRYSVIFGANRDLIRDPDLIYPDQVFTIPELVEAE